MIRLKNANLLVAIVVLPAPEVNWDLLFPGAAHHASGALQPRVCLRRAFGGPGSAGRRFRAAPRPGHNRSAPHLPGYFQDHLHLFPPGRLGQHIAFLGRGKAALGRKTELVEGDEFRRLVDALLDVVLLFQRARFRRDQTEHDLLAALRHEAERLETAGPFGVVFEEIAVIADLAEQRFGDRLVAAPRYPGGAEVTAADMGRDDHVGGAVLDRRVDDLGVDFGQAGGIVAALLGEFAFLRRAQIRPHGVVELQVAAPRLVEDRNRILVGFAEVGEEPIQIRIHVLRNAFAAPAKVQHRGRRNCHLRGDPGVLFYETEVLDERVILEVQLAADLHAARLGLYACKLNPVFRLVTLDPAETFEKVEMPPGAAILTVGDE